VKKALVIGYGNTLRSDDGVGVWVADRIAALRLPNVDLKTCHQLFPELAADILPYDTVIMVDASANGEPMAVRKSLPLPEHLPSSNHNISPEILHHLAHEMYGATVDMRVYTVRGDSFEFGSMLSPSVKEQATKTVALIAALLRQIHPKSMIASFMLN
jgi:hydrogenase maturation protease